jgi:hypothetical protein
MTNQCLDRTARLTALALIVSTAPAFAQDATPTAPKPAPSLASAYRGVFVCDKLASASDILHVPIDLAVRGDAVQFARPMFNLNGSRVYGSELGTGTVDASGNVRLQSEWMAGGAQVQGSYAGTLTPDSGTLSGKQTWRLRDGTAGGRNCQIALVPAVNAVHTAGN